MPLQGFRTGCLRGMEHYFSCIVQMVILLTYAYIKMGQKFM